jgi:hypothetical protein
LNTSQPKCCEEDLKKTAYWLTGNSHCPLGESSMCVKEAQQMKLLLCSINPQKSIRSLGFALRVGTA